MARRIEVVPHDPNWADLYREEAGKLAAIFGEAAVGIHHVGSTAVPGLNAKPVIDVLVEVDDLEKVEGFNGPMIELGYESKGEHGIPKRRYFSKDTAGVRTHHVHVFQSGHLDIQRMLNFRDYLSAHPDDVRAYQRLKEALAKKFPEDIVSYTEGKSEFIRGIDQKAKAWRETLS